MDGSSWAAWSIAVPLLGAVATLVLGARGRNVVLAIVLAATALAVAALAREVGRDGPIRHRLAGWGAPLGIELYADGLAVLFLAVAAVVGVATVIYATAYYDLSGPEPRARGSDRYFWPLGLFLWAALNAVFLADDAFNLYVALELLGLAAVALVALAGTRGATVAATRYLLLSLLGSALFLVGVALLYARYGTLSLSLLGILVEREPAAWIALAGMTIGLLLKTALFPLHGWLPPAHGAAPAPASALLSGVVVKASFAALLRLWLDVFPMTGEHGALLLLGLLGAGAVLWGSSLALRQRDLKRLVAYSTVGQLGYLFLLFPLVADGGPAPGAGYAGWAGGVYHAASHAFAKAAMFLAAGAMVRAVGTGTIQHLAGTGHAVRLSFAAFGIAGLSLTGLPPSGGFVAKWLLLQAALANGRWLWALLILAGSLLAAAYVLVVIRQAFQRPDAARPLAPVPLRMELAALVLALVSMAMGIWALGPLGLLEVGAPPALLGAIEAPGPVPIEPPVPVAVEAPGPVPMEALVPGIAAGPAPVAPREVGP